MKVVKTGLGQVYGGYCELEVLRGVVGEEC